MNQCRSLLVDLRDAGRPLHDMFDGCDGPRMRRLMRFARLGLVEVTSDDHIVLTDSGTRVLEALWPAAAWDLPPAADEAEALNAFERIVHRLVGPPLAGHRSAA